jgi:hypothetical protein
MHRFSTSSPCVWFLIGILASFTLLFIPLSVQHVNGASVTLAWDPNPEGNLAGYKVYYGTASGSYSIKVDVGNWTSLTISNLEAGRTYYFAATAYDTGGEESGKSNELRYDTPGPDSRSLSPAQASNGSAIYTIYASAGPNGSISPSGYITVRRGSSKTYIIRPKSGYGVGRVYIDGVSMNYVTSHTFKQINASHTIRAEFVPIWSNKKKTDVPPSN